MMKKWRLTGFVEQMAEKLIFWKNLKVLIIRMDEKSVENC